MKAETVEFKAISRGSLAIAAFSTIVEWYDFTLYLYFATVLSRVFFGPGELSLLTTLGGFAIAYLMRPLGAVFFGHIGDRTGRRRMLLFSVALMTAAMLATARAADLFADRRRGRLAAVPAALRDGLLGRRRIYRRGRLSARRCAIASARPGRLPGLGGERNRRPAGGRRVGLDRRLAGRSRACKAGAGAFPSLLARRWRERSGSPDRPWRNRPNFIASWPSRPFRDSPLRHCLSNHRARNRPGLRHLGARIDHLLCRHHLCPRLPDHRPDR